MTRVVAKDELFLMQNNATTGNGDIVMPAPGIKDHIFYIRTNAGVNAGAIQLESASEDTYSGDWAPLVNELTTPTTNPVVVVAEDEEIYIYHGVLQAVRARISTTISGGETPGVTVRYKGN